MNTTHFEVKESTTFGYRIIHTPSNYLLTVAGFTIESDAVEFANACESLFDGWLDRKERDWMQRYFAQNPHWMRDVFHSLNLRGGFERVTMAEVKRLAQRAQHA